MRPKSSSRAQRHRAPWTEDEDLLLLSRTLSNSELARQLGRTGKAVRHRRFAEAVQELGEDGATFVHKVKTAGWRWNTLGESSQN